MLCKCFVNKIKFLTKRAEIYHLYICHHTVCFSHLNFRHFPLLMLNSPCYASGGDRGREPGRIGGRVTGGRRGKGGKQEF